jgi:hypothetical protein
MGEHEWNFRHASISVVVGLALGIATTLLAAQSGPPTTKWDLIAGLFAGLLSAILSMQILHSAKLEKVEGISRTAVEGGDRAFNIVSVNSTLTSKIRELHDLPPVVADVALHALQEAINGIDVEKDDYSTYIKGRRLALLCYSRFWSNMVDLQRRSRKPLIARVTHSTDVEIFHDKQALSLRGLHKDFTLKGNMFRILIDREPIEAKRVKDYLRAIDEMDGIHCAYINIADPNHQYLLGDYPELEYCLVEGSIKFCSEWKLRDAGDVKAHVLTTHPHRYGQYLESWNGLVAHIKSDDCGYEGAGDQNQQRLLKLKTNFLAAYDRAIGKRRNSGRNSGSRRKPLFYRWLS